MNKRELDQAAKDTSLIFKVISTGRADREERLPLVAVAFRHMHEWAGVRMPPHDDGPRGGSSSPLEIDERRADQALGRNAATHRDELERLMRTLALTAERAVFLVQRYTAVDAKALAEVDSLNSVTPGCVSCARIKKKGALSVGGHWAPIDPRYKTGELCRWCGDALASDHELPPVEVVDKYHREGAQAAGRKLAELRRQPKKTA